MTAVAFDTLKLARRLESAGFTHDQADGAAAALAETFAGEIATRSDIAGVQGEITALRVELKGDIAGVQGDIAALRAELKGTSRRSAAICAVRSPVCDRAPRSGSSARSSSTS